VEPTRLAKGWSVLAYVAIGLLFAFLLWDAFR
jgi:hypothetical protein